MNTRTISFRDKTAPDYHPSIIFHSYRNMVIDNNNIFTPRMPEVKDQPGQVAYVLAREVRNLLGHINLSVEMLEFLIDDNDLKMYLDVIMRSSIRMNDLINKFLESHQVDEVPFEKFSIHQLPYKVCLK
jgi:nitrogen-specific signal transduction histidine kinase